MFVYGESEHQIDDKGRINVPKRLHPLFERAVFLTRSFDNNCLIAWGHEPWEEMKRMLASIPFTEKATDIVERCISCGCEVTLDAQGRLTIPPNLRRRANLTDEVTVIGRGQKMEIWNTAAWLAYDAANLTGDAVEDALSQISQRLPARV